MKNKSKYNGEVIITDSSEKPFQYAWKIFKANSLIIESEMTYNRKIDALKSLRIEIKKLRKKQ